MFPLISVFRLASRRQPGFRLSGEAVSLPRFQALLERRNRETYRLPLVITQETLSSLPDEPLRPCLLVSHRDHPKSYFRHCILFEMQNGVPVLDMKYGGQREGRADVKDEYRYYEELGLLFEGCCQEMVSGRAR